MFSSHKPLTSKDSLIREYSMFSARTLFLTLSFIIPGIALAQTPGGMDQAQIEKMMQGMSQMAACYQNLDQEKLKALGAEAQAMEKELNRLCADGQRDEAQRQAMAFGLKFAGSEEFQQLRQCGEMAASAMPAIPDYSVYADPESADFKNRHVCDDR
jgi:hypothetical protein